jgi:hypothetical protein
MGHSCRLTGSQNRLFQTFGERKDPARAVFLGIGIAKRNIVFRFPTEAG